MRGSMPSTSLLVVVLVGFVGSVKRMRTIKSPPIPVQQVVPEFTIRSGKRTHVKYAAPLALLLSVDVLNKSGRSSIRSFVEGLLRFFR